MSWEELDAIADNIRNGNKSDAFQKIAELEGAERLEMLNYFECELCDDELAIAAARIFFYRAEVSAND